MLLTAAAAKMDQLPASDLNENPPLHVLRAVEWPQVAINVICACLTCLQSKLSRFSENTGQECTFSFWTMAPKYLL